MIKSQKKKIFTWHIHGSYLFYLSQGNYDIYIPVTKDRDEGYYGRGLTFPFGPNVIEVQANKIRDLEFDLILFQTDKNYQHDQYSILSEEQRKLPRIFLKHDPPPSLNSPLIVDDPDVMVVHVTDFNKLMWDNHGLKSTVIQHGVTDNGYLWNGHLQKGIVVINNLSARGRNLGTDVFDLVNSQLPVDIIGMGTEDLGGKEVLHPYLPEYIANYRFFLNPIRYSSMPLSLCEAMMAGLPVIALSVTELPSVIRDGENGFINNDPNYLISKMKLLIENFELAKKLSENSRYTALQKFSIKRFINEWTNVFDEVTQRKPVDLKSC